MTTDDIFNEKYYINKYTAELESIIGKCKCDHFDVLNSDADSRLCEIMAYVFTKSPLSGIDDLIELLKDAVDIYCNAFERDTGMEPGFKKWFYYNYTYYRIGGN